MSELTPKQLEALARERANIFTPGWFADLVSARLGFGDTFWLGLFGVLLFVVPAVVLIGGLLYAQAPGALMPFFRIAAGLYALWTLGVLQALLRLGRHGGYPVAGLVVTAGIAVCGLYAAVTL